MTYRLSCSITLSIIVLRYKFDKPVIKACFTRTFSPDFYIFHQTPYTNVHIIHPAKVKIVHQSAAKCTVLSRNTDSIMLARMCRSIHNLRTAMHAPGSMCDSSAGGGESFSNVYTQRLLVRGAQEQDHVPDAVADACFFLC